MNDVFLSEIYIYPIKSLGGISLESSEISLRGLKHDRRYMLIDENRNFVTQREFSSLALIKVNIDGENLVCSINNNIIKFPLLPKTNNFIDVKVWRSNCKAELFENNINDWFSDYLNENVKLVYMPETTERAVNPLFSINNDIVSFADGYPYLIASQSSLDDLNSKLEKKINMDRFRPNLVIRGLEPFIEDKIKELRIGNIKFFLVKPCERCVITTIDQDTGINNGKEPLKTLSTYKRKDNKVTFGQNSISEQKNGTLNIGDKIGFIKT
ncbi:MAG: MOSC domain-containing protein [Candidatus Sericytochromatia bacterium]